MSEDTSLTKKALTSSERSRTCRKRKRDLLESTGCQFKRISFADSIFFHGGLYEAIKLITCSSSCRLKPKSVDMITSYSYKSGYENTLSSIHGKEILCFHGTNSSNANSILLSGFDDKYIKDRCRHHGFYFSQYLSTCLLYGNVVLACKVVLGRCKRLSKSDSFKYDLLERKYNAIVRPTTEDKFDEIAIRDKDQVSIIGIINF